MLRTFQIPLVYHKRSYIYLYDLSLCVKHLILPIKLPIRFKYFTLMITVIYVTYFNIYFQYLLYHMLPKDLWRGCFVH